MNAIPQQRHSLDHQQSLQTLRQSSPIGSEGPLNLLLAACQRAEEEAEAERGDNISSIENSDVEEIQALLPHAAFVSRDLDLLSEDCLSEADSSTSEEGNDWEDDEGEKRITVFFLD